MTEISIFIWICIHKACRFCLYHKIIKSRLNTGILFCDCIFFCRNIVQSNVCFKIFLFLLTWFNTIFKGKCQESISEIMDRTGKHSINWNNHMRNCSIKLKLIFLRFRTIIVHCFVISSTTICKCFK